MAYIGNQTLPGLKPVTNGVAGTAPRIRMYDVAAAYAVAIGEGCLLIKTAAGLELAGTTTDGFVAGVAAQNLAASTGGRIAVYDDPEQEFMCIADGSIAAAVAIEMVGQYVSMLAGTNVFSAVYRQGLTEIDISSVNGTAAATHPLQVIAPATNVGEVRTAADSQVRVKVAHNSHMLSFGGDTPT